MKGVEVKSKHVFITLDGVDGSGKSTVAELLAKNGSYQYHKSPSGPYAELRKEIDAHASPLERYCFYRLATQFDSLQIRRLLETRSVVCDRYLASTAAHHFVLDARTRAIHNDTGILKPHFAFLLGARSEVRDKRLLERPNVLSDAKFKKNSAILDRVAEVFKSFGLIYVDTSDRVPEETAAVIENFVRRGETP